MIQCTVSVEKGADCPCVFVITRNTWNLALKKKFFPFAVCQCLAHTVLGFVGWLVCLFYEIPVVNRPFFSDSI